MGGDEFQELPSLLQETVFQSAVTVHVEFETLHTHEHKNDMSVQGNNLSSFFPLLHAFCPLRISLLSSIRTSSQAHAFKKTSSLICQEDCIVQRLLFHCPRELMGESNQKLHPDFHLPQIYKEKCSILHRRILTFLHSFHET